MPDIEIVHKPIGLSSEDATKLLYSIQPHLIRIETRAGHGSGKPTSKNIEEAADVYAFLGHFTGMDGAR